VSDRGLSASSEQENRTVKKTVMALGGFLALGVLCYVGQLSGQTQQQNYPPQTAAAPAAPRTRIALLNLTYVIKNYKKYLNFQEEIKSVVEPFQTTDAKLRQDLEGLRKQAESSATKMEPQETRDRIERQAKDIQRRMEDNTAEAKLKLGARSDEEMKILFTDVYQAAQGYAASHDFELVLHYNDAVTTQDFLSAQNIARKLNTGALMPLITTPNLDISRDIVALLNSNMQSSGAAPPGTPPAGAPH
jgi:Skp family chaperone for outer membrane proteins